MKRLLRDHALFAALFGTLFVVFLGPLLVLSKTFAHGDYALQFYPWSRHFADALREGRFPYWTDLMAGGFPLVAEGQIGAYYALNLAMLRFMPFVAAYTWSIPLHILLGGVGAYAYGRRIGLSRDAAALSAAVFSFGSGYGGCFYTTGTLRALTWLPWSLWCVEALADERHRGRRALAFFFLAILTSQSWTAGFPQAAFYAGAYVGLYALLLTGKRFTTAPAAAGAMAVGVFLAAPQVLATLELAGVSVREGETAAFALWGSVPPPAVLSLAFPEWGKVGRVSFYAGAVPLVLALFSAFTPKSSAERRHAALFVVFLLLAFGKYNPLYAWAVEATGFTGLRNPSKFLFFAVTSLAWLAGFGADKLWKRAHGAAARRTAAATAVLALVLALGPAAVFGAFGPAIEKKAVAYADAVHRSKAEPLHDTGHYRAIALGAIERARGLANPLHPWTAYSLAMLSAAAALAFFTARGSLKYPASAAAAAALMALDLSVFGLLSGTGFIGNARRVPPERDLLAAHVAEAVNAEDFVFAEFASDPKSERFAPNVPMRFGFAHAGGYSPLLLKRPYELAKELGFMDASLGRHPFDAAIWKREKGVLDALGVKHVLSDAELDVPGFRLAEKLSGRFHYENEGALPPLYAVYAWRTIPDKAERLAFLKSEAFRPAEEAVVEDAGVPTGAFAGAPDRTRWDRFNRNPLRVDGVVSLPSDALIVFRHPPYPTWRAAVDGEPAEVFAVNHAFMGVFVGEGERHVAFYHDGSRQTLVERAALGAWILVLLSAALTARRLVRRA